MLKLLQKLEVETNDIQRIIKQMVQLQWTREEVYKKTQIIHDEIEIIHDKRVKADDF